MLGLLVAMVTAASLSRHVVSVQTIVNITAGQNLPSGTWVVTPKVGGLTVTETVVDLIADSCIFPEDNLFLRRVAYMETRDGLSPSTYPNNAYSGGIWQVDESMFRMTRGNTGPLQAKYAAIRAAFGIDWMSVTWADLQKPLYSGLAAALYTVVQGPVPADLEQQATYAHSKYNTRNTEFNFTRVVNQIPVCTRGHNQTMDLVFLLDATTTAADFKRMHEFAQQVVEGLVGDIRVAVYQFGTGQYLQINLRFGNYPNIAQAGQVLQSLQQIQTSRVAPDTGGVLHSVLIDAWSNSIPRAIAAKMVVLITDQTASSSQTMTEARQYAATNGISLVTVGVGQRVNTQQLDELATYPKCRHHLSVLDFQDLKFYIQLLQRTICHEPMIAQGMVHCRIDDCRNVAFPITSSTTTLIANVTCDDGRVYVTTRMNQPGRGFEDYSGVVEARTGAKYVTFVDDVGKFIYADFFGIGSSDPSCMATMSTVNGIVGPPVTLQCEDWRYPDVNPCLTPNRQTPRFPYDFDHGWFIQCDLQNVMYLTKCPPDAPYYSADCETCVGGSNSPTIAECLITVVSTPYCGLADNPCTQENIVQRNFYFACPINETLYLQCNTWGHAYIKQCPENEVWREQAMSCEFHNTNYNPCGTIPNERFYPYPRDPNMYVDCGGDDVPNLMHCWANLVWNQEQHTCDYQHGTTLAPVSHLTQLVTARPFATTPSGSVTPDPFTGLLSTGYVDPCSLSNVQSGLLFHPYPNHPTMYIQCDLWGDSFAKSCQPGYSYNPDSHTCVNGPVHVIG